VSARGTVDDLRELYLALRAELQQYRRELTDR